jgi:adenine-specific DNA-methyltransferase
MSKKPKLELTWIGKEQRPRLEPRVLVEDSQLSCHAAERVSESDLFDNRLIFGDNLLALKALEQEFTGKIKCIYIDPPYNTGAAFDQYDDGIEHSLWLSLMRDRLEILRRLLTPDGSLWISIDDNEAAYLRVVLDEVFGRANFVSTIIWEKRTSRENRRVFSFNHDYIIVFARDRTKFEPVRNLLPFNDEVRSRYKNPDNDPRGPWQSVSANAMAGHATPSQFYKLKTPSGALLDPPEGRCWLYTKDRMEEEIASGNIWFGANGRNVPRIKKFLRDTEGRGLTPETLWWAKEVGTNDDAKKDLISLFNGKLVFDTPKPEPLVSRIIEIATNQGEWVLDSFAGSGTTGAVAQKMGRQWIMVELGEHCHTAILPRLQKVIDGNDAFGVTEAVRWKGGGGFRYFSLAPSLLQQDQFGNWIINKKYNPVLLTQAVCKVEGFTYAPSETVYWQQGHSSERDFIYVTTQTLTRQQIESLAEEVGPHRSLVIYCHAFRVKDVNEFPNLTLKKIPKTVLNKCEWGHDDYSLEIKNLPTAAPEPTVSLPTAPPPRRKRDRDNGQPNLFSREASEK